MLDDHPAPRPNIEDTIKLMNSLEEMYKDAQTLLAGKTMEKFPKMSCDPSVFVPSIPPELSVEFHIDSHELVCTMRALRFYNHQPQGHRSIVHGWMKSPEVYEHGNKFVEVVDDVTARTHAPSMAMTWCGLTQAIELCEGYRERLYTLKDVLM